MLLEDKNFCVKNCTFLDSTPKNNFWCAFYNKKLDTMFSLSGNSIRPVKCLECIQDGERVSKEQEISVAEEYLYKARNFIDLALRKIK